MKFFTLILIASCGFASGQADRKQSLTKYRQLWERSLVTDKPEKVEPPKGPGVLDDYVLGGWTQTSQGYVVSLINKKNPKERLTIAPGIPNKDGFQVMDAKRDPSGYKGSQVLVRVGGEEGWVGYEDKFLTIQQPVAKRPTRGQRKPTPNNANRQNGSRQQVPTPTSNNNTQGSSGRRPRVRRVPVPPKK